MKNTNTYCFHLTALERRYGCVVDLCSLKADARMTTAQKDAVLAILRKWAMTREDFWSLDDRPGDWGYHRKQKGVVVAWHWKLRQTRNDPSVQLLEALSPEKR